ncbi:MAG: hypothetical protein ACJ72E_01710 [Marmoricola sp.]
MKYSPLTNRFTRAVGASLAAALVLTSGALLTAASAKVPHGSLAEVILETKDVTGQPYYASLHGWWGHEGAKDDTGKRPTVPSLDLSDGHGVVDTTTTDAIHKALGDGGDFSSLRVAFVPFSADGSNERPQVTKDEPAGKAFRWFADLGVGTALNGTSSDTDFVSWVSTQDEYTRWWNAGRPAQGFTKNLGVLDVAGNNGHPSATPEGRSILNRWPAGTKVSMVFYVSDGVDKQMPQEPTVKVGPDGHAMTAWMTFETVASPTNPARTSGGYKVLTGQGTGPHAAAKPQKAPAGTSASDGATPGTAAAADAGAGSAHATASSASDSGFTSSLPGGKPTFWILLVIVVIGAAGGLTLRMRSGLAPPR